MSTPVESWPHLRAQIAAPSRDRSPDAPELIEARRNLRAGRPADHVEEALADALPLTADQRLAIARLLAGGGSDASPAPDFTEPHHISVDVSQFVKRLFTELIDADEQTIEWWERRATQFAEVGTPGCAEIVRACRNKAALLRMHPAEGSTPDVENGWREGDG